MSPSSTRMAVGVCSAALVLATPTTTAAAPSPGGTATLSPASAAEVAGQAGAAVRKRIATTRWSARALRRGHFSHTRHKGGIRIGRRPTRVMYDDPYGRGGSRAYRRGTWTSPWVRPGFAVTELIASYNARTPYGTFITISVRGNTLQGKRSSWDSLGRWAGHDRKFHRMSLGDQRDDFSRVAVDTLVTNGRSSYRSWQLRISLYRLAGTSKTPVVRMVSGAASRMPRRHAGTSRTSMGKARSLTVPRYSQEIHRGEYPRWDGGGEAWCSPTSTSMVLAYWNRGPSPRQYSWVRDSYAQPWVDYAARYTYAWGYGGTGMWPFNTAYAGKFGLNAFVTRLRSLREAELFIKAGIPLVASVSFGPGQLDGSPLNSTNGHLLVIRGFTARGRVIVNDPAGANAKHVRRVYKRRQFERAWADNGDGVVYVIHPRTKRLPKTAKYRNW